MIILMHTTFLQDAQEYALAEKYWIDRWHQIEGTTRSRFGWQQPWFHPLPPNISQGNPIFSAVSPQLKRGIRVIQHEPTSASLEIQAWPDTFGGSVTDPESIRELVIACALSDVSAALALEMMEPWVAGHAVSFLAHHRGGPQLPGRSARAMSGRFPQITMRSGYDAA
jgi:hypothetical protein